MTQTPFFDAGYGNNEMSNYFDSLPKAVQETIIQSHGKVQTLSELKSLAEGLMGND